MLYLLQALIIIIILLFNVINIKQKAKIKKLFKIRPVYLFVKIISTHFLQEICIRVYTYILISLKLLITKRFHKTLINPTFRVYIGLVIINKVHFIAN